MNSKFFCSLFFLCLPPYVFCAEEKGTFLSGIGPWLATEAKKGIKYFEDYGAGKQALKELAQKDVIIERQGKSIEAVALAATNTPGSGDHAPAIQNTQNRNGTANNNSNQTNTDGKFEEKIVIALGSIYIIKSGYDFYNFFYTWIWPNPEDQIRKENAIKQLAILSAETQLNKCLARNMYKDRSGNEMPSKCEDVSVLFAEAAGSEALEKIMCQYSLLKKRFCRD